MKMSERKFKKSLGKPGTAAQLRETVSQVVKETTEQVSSVSCYDCASNLLLPTF